MLKKILIKYTIILVLNLFAFLALWYILDLIFESWWIFIILSLILSIFTLVIFTQILVKKNLKKLEKINENKH